MTMPAVAVVATHITDDTCGEKHIADTSWHMRARCGSDTTAEDAEASTVNKENESKVMPQTKTAVNAAYTCRKAFS